MPRLYRVCRDDNGVLVDVQFERHGHELAGPQLAVRIGEVGLEDHGAGGRVDRIVDERERSHEGRVAAVLGRRADGERLPLAAPEDLGELAFGDGKAHGDRTQLVDYHERRVPLRADQVSLFDEEPSGPARDRRANGRVVKVQPCDLDLCLVGLNRCGEGAGRGDEPFGLRLGHRLVLRELHIAVGLTPGILVLCLVLGELGFRGVERCPERARIDLEQYLAGPDLVPFPEIDAGQDAADLRLHADRLQGLDRPVRDECVRHGAGLGGGDRYRDLGMSGLFLLLARGEAENGGERNEGATKEHAVHAVRGDPDEGDKDIPQYVTPITL